MNKKDYEKYYQNELKSYQEMYFDKVMIINKAIEKLYCWGKALNPEFKKQMLDILKGVE